ncbi:hypothetical protein [Roseomonas sp. USHLN139]|uniref:hypothetical protein n=1 Tax=Roseomonas sp. USHLN139 TaxID=3081298 RepID=UPI003B01C90F
MRALLLAGLCLVAAAGGAAAQGGPPQPGQETLFREIDRPLQALLDEGWQISGMAGNLGGIGYVLHKDGKWVTCQVISRREDTRSRCMMMN